jgi:hypothetical protein
MTSLVSGVQVALLPAPSTALPKKYSDRVTHFIGIAKGQFVSKRLQFASGKG